MQEHRPGNTAEVRIPIGGPDLRMTVPVGRREEPGPRISFWFELSAAAVALARDLQAGGELRGKRALELGCGLGLAGIAAGRLGAEVTFTDAVEEALRFAELNAGANGARHTSFKFLDWEHPGDLGRFDLILGSEILYDYFVHDALRSLLAGALSPGGTIRLADRARLCVDRFLGRLVHEGFSCRERKERVCFAGLPGEEISIFTLGPPS
jgi:2-polyprenyl-3-methyl-5-hydroxy-6-metoxy-1,4-benzoquinol methylase